MLDVLEFVYQYIDAFALLVLSSIGLIVIFGVMGVINMAHGELMMVGAFGAAYAHRAGLPVAAAIVAGAITGLFVGVVLERTVIRFLYGRLLSSLVATWGISLMLSQGALIILGPSAPSLPSVFGSFSVGGFSFAYYRVFLFVLSLGLIALLWAVLRFTPIGLQARATMSDPNMARALGVNTRRIYMLTFGFGSFLAGLAGGLFSLTGPVQPNFGASFTPVAFIVVVVAGSRNIVIGLTVSALILAFAKTLFTIHVNILTGYVAMLLAAFVVIRVAPDGIIELLIRARRFQRRSAVASHG